MLLRNSISTTKKFFQKTIGSLKSFFFKRAYQKLRKSSHRTLFSCHQSMPVDIMDCSYRDLEKFYAEITDDLHSNIDEPKRKNSEKASPPPSKQEKEFQNRSIWNKKSQMAEDYAHYKLKSGVIHERKKAENSFLKGGIERRRSLVSQKIKQLEMLDRSNEDHVLDIEEVVHYYSRLTCPAYLEIVDGFFMELYAEFFGIR